MKIQRGTTEVNKKEKMTVTIYTNMAEHSKVIKRVTKDIISTEMSQ